MNFGDIHILGVDDPIPEAAAKGNHQSQVWFFYDRKLPECLSRRCEFPNRAVLERTIRTLLVNNADYKVNPGDFYFKHICDEAWDDIECKLYVKYYDGNDIIEVKDYAN